MKTKAELSDLSKRFLESIEKTGKTRYAIAKEINGITESQLTHISSGRYEPSKKTLDAFFNVYPEYRSFVLMGETRGFVYDSLMQSLKEPPSDIIKEAASKMNVLRDQANLNTVPLLPISAQAGTLNDFIVSIKDSDTERIISPIKGADFAITVTGDSMSPEFPNGSQILIKKVNENSFIEWGKVYVLDTINGVILKIVNEGDSDSLLCTSINLNQSRYAPFSIPKSGILGVYRVMLCMSMK